MRFIAKRRCEVTAWYDWRIRNISTECPKKMLFSGKIAITTLKFIQNAKNWGVLENSGYLLPNGH